MEFREGQRVIITWSGGNGPWEYRVQIDKWGNPYFVDQKFAQLVGFPREARSIEIIQELTEGK